ncbi:MAG: M48 family metallopeptidase [Cyanophyceae cyanobacterium]
MLRHFSLVLRRSRRRWFYGLLSALVAVSITLAAPTASYSFSLFDLLLRGIQVVQLSNLSAEREVQLGKQINQQLIQGGRIKLNQNPPLNRYINSIGQRLAQASSRRDLPYTFQVVEDKSVNAFATMGGYVYVHTGLIEKADNEAELASVVAHEIGHIASRHAVEQMRQQAIAQGVLSAAGLDTSTAVQIGVDLAVNRPNSRDDEFQADQLGLETLRQAGYAPSGMVSFMRKLLQQGGSPPSFLSTHPATSDRIAALEQAIDPQSANVGDGLDNQAYANRVDPLI